MEPSASRVLPQTQSSELRSSLSVLSPHAVLRLRFPVPDLRPPSLRRPPSQRAVRQETLVLELCNLEVKHREGPDLQAEPPSSSLHQHPPAAAPPSPLPQPPESPFSDLPLTRNTHPLLPKSH